MPVSTRRGTFLFSASSSPSADGPATTAGASSRTHRGRRGGRTSAPVVVSPSPSDASPGPRRGGIGSDESSSSCSDGTARNIPDFAAFAYDGGAAPTMRSAIDDGGDDARRRNRRSTRSAVAVSGGKREEKADAASSSMSTTPQKVAPRRTAVGPASATKKRCVTAAKAATPSPKKTKKQAKAARQKGDDEQTKSSAEKSTPSPRRKQQRRTKIEPGSLPPPPDWRRIYRLVEQLRSDRTAPVDTDGGHELPERHRGKSIWRFQVLIALMLSSQTKDAVVGQTMRSLQRHGLDVTTISNTNDTTLNSLIRKVGFHNNKTKYIKETVRILLNEHGGEVPRTATELMNLPGVGPKMAYIVESVCYGTTSGIGVDTHMHRIFNELKWVESKTPEQTRVQLEGWLPRNKWSTVNVLWVGLGQEVQQQKAKVLQKAIECADPVDAIRLLERLGMDVSKEAKRHGIEEEVRRILEEKK